MPSKIAIAEYSNVYRIAARGIFSSICQKVYQHLRDTIIVGIHFQPMLMADPDVVSCIGKAKLIHSI